MTGVVRETVTAPVDSMVVRPNLAPGRASSAPCHSRLSLLGGFELLVDGCQMGMPHSAQRLLALLALQDRPVSRCYVAGVLWPNYSESRAAGSLRSALWRVRKAGPDLVDSHDSAVSIGADVGLDTRDLVNASRGLLAGGSACDGSPLRFDERLFCRELLPDWYEDWVLLDRERLRQLRLASLERLAGSMIESSDYLGAIHASMAAVQCDALRESAHRVLVRAHIAVGNYSEAIRQFNTYAELLDKAMGLRPSPLITELVEPLLGDPR